MKDNPLQARFQLKPHSRSAIIYIPGSYVLGRRAENHTVDVKLSRADIGDDVFSDSEMSEVTWLMGGQVIGIDGTVSREHLMLMLSQEGLQMEHTSDRHPTVYYGQYGPIEIQRKLLTPGCYFFNVAHMPLMCTIEPYNRSAIEQCIGFPRECATQRSLLARLRAFLRR